MSHHAHVYGIVVENNYTMVINTRAVSGMVLLHSPSTMSTLLTKPVIDVKLITRLPESKLKQRSAYRVGRLYDIQVEFTVD